MKQNLCDLWSTLYFLLPSHALSILLLTLIQPQLGCIVVAPATNAILAVL